MGSASPRPDDDRRDILLVCHGSVDDASEVRVLAQCATASLHLRSGMRKQTRFWLVLADRGFTLVCDGRRRRGGDEANDWHHEDRKSVV